MSQSRASAAVYEEFVPSSELVPEKDADTLRVFLPDFTKEQMTVKRTRKVILKISGERPVGQKRYQKFQMEFPVSENCDERKISAKLQNGILYVKQPKLVTSARKKDKELPPLPKKPVSEPQIQNKTEEQDSTEKSTLIRDDFTKQDNAENNPAKEPVKEASNKTSPKTSEANSLEKKSRALEDGETQSCCSKQDESMKDNGIKEAFQFLKEKAAGDSTLPKQPANEPQDQKKADEQAVREKTTLRDETTPAKEEPQSTNPNTSKQTQVESIQEKSSPHKYSTSTSEDGKTSSDNKPDESINDATKGTAGDSVAKKNTARKVINMTLVALLIMGIGGYVINAMKSTKKAKK